MTQEEKKHHWSFQRIGGLDQVVLNSGQDLYHLKDLNPQLWVALSCPTNGLEFDKRTLASLDIDSDGHIRIPEVIEATNWVCARLNNLDGLINRSDVLPLDYINTEHEEGKKLLATAHAILEEQDALDRTYLTEADVVKVSKRASQAIFNGDGVFPPLDALQEDVRLFIQDALAVMGGVADASGKTGINLQIAQSFVEVLTNWQGWRSGLKSVTSVLGDDTPQAWKLMQELKTKIDDYFLRVDLASYAPQAQVALNVDEKSLVPSENGLLVNDALAALPLSKIEPSSPLNLVTGLNPVWRSQMELFAQLITPLLSEPEQMTRQEWKNIQKALDSYAQVARSEPKPEVKDVTVVPNSSIDALGDERRNAILAGDVLKRFKTMSKKDLQTPVAATDIAGLERLVIYHKYLYRLLMNFVSFSDFFQMEDSSAAFQTGALYIDGRRCDLCVPVKDVQQHIVLASYTELFLLYCECTRQTQEGQPPEKRIIAAAVTMGNSDLLVEGRNGVFIDKQGNDWDAKVIKVIDKPISLRQAIWTPYKRVGKLMTDQLSKWAESKDNSIAQASATPLQSTANVIAAPAATPTAPVAAPAKFDIARSAGIFAALGLAFGAIGTTLAAITKGLFEMQWWQFPILFAGLFVLISGPSFILAWLKLRQRTLGPLLESSGWAINGRVKINYALGGMLTSEAELPLGTTRDMLDPLKDKRKIKRLILIVITLVTAFCGGTWAWYNYGPFF